MIIQFPGGGVPHTVPRRGDLGRTEAHNWRGDPGLQEPLVQLRPELGKAALGSVGQSNSSLATAREITSTSSLYPGNCCDGSTDTLFLVLICLAPLSEEALSESTSSRRETADA
ncbi:hypothetical protein Baya_5960 [Bagarius yarrelli]|uniref:Uncharacterized protein n=1 Tax=Bagarius yarrelli TaxID=175774 RepID=A0A556U0P4_BAGYA|nr:hypothetical protein Baya_5960 [Bagarius yarrelli]